MGQTLSEPVLSKESKYAESEGMRVASSSMQGWRTTMEDSLTHILALNGKQNLSFFAVYDGHGGDKCSDYVSKHLHNYLIDNIDFDGVKNVSDLQPLLKNAFLDFDDLVRSEIESSGTTAIVVIVRDHDLIVANVGDSRAIAYANDACQPLSTDHKPNLDSERLRIEKAGGSVQFNRVNGNLALSRAFGDFAYKKDESLSREAQLISACPDVRTYTINEDWKFIVLACDGIWDVLSSQEVCDFVKKRLGMKLEPEEICEQLIDKCLAPDCNSGSNVGCDNFSVILICLN